MIEGQRLGEIEGMCRQAVQQQQQVYSKEVALEDAQKINGDYLPRCAIFQHLFLFMLCIAPVLQSCKQAPDQEFAFLCML